MRNGTRTNVVSTKVLSLLLFAGAVLFLFASPGEALAQSTKRGLGLRLDPSDSHNPPRLRNLNVAWYYNWGYQGIPSQDGTYDYVHMVYSVKHISSDPIPSQPYSHILGFNEPDNAQESNISPATALANWSSVTNRGSFVISPATAQNPLTGHYPSGTSNSSWLSQFLDSNPKVDAIGVHHYGCTASTLQQLLTDIHNKWGKPIWLTEFACETESQASGSGSHPSQAEVDTFINSMKPFLDNTSWIQRYVWHDALTGTSTLFTTDGHSNDDLSSTLTETGSLIAGK